MLYVLIKQPLLQTWGFYGFHDNEFMALRKTTMVGQRKAANMQHDKPTLTKEPFLDVSKLLLLSEKFSCLGREGGSSMCWLHRRIPQNLIFQPELL